MAGSSNDFEEFKKQTDDAWDGGDDDLLLEAFNVRISRRDVQSAATQVSITLLLLTVYSITNGMVCSHGGMAWCNCANIVCIGVKIKARIPFGHSRED